MSQKRDAINSLRPLFNPESIAVIGASSNPRKPGGRQVKALLKGKFAGKIYPINPGAESIEGLKCFPSLAEIPDTVELAILCIGADTVYKSLQECYDKGVKAAIVFASGFSETGVEGQAEQQRIAEFARKANIRLVGPNCVGLVNATNGMIGSFSPGLTDVAPIPEKHVAFVTQSGAFGVLTYIAAMIQGLGINYFISVGNEMDTEFSEFIEFLVNDDKTKVITGYMEGAKDGNNLRRVAEEALETEKPIVIMKTGRSSAGSRAAASHTGSLAGADKIYDAFFKQTGIVRAVDYEDIISFSKLAASGKLPTGKNVVIVTASGGLGINYSDKFESAGLNILPLNKETRAKISQVLPSFAGTSNPIDVTAAATTSNPEYYVTPIKALCEDPDVDIIFYTEFGHLLQPDSPLIKEFIETIQKSDKLIVISAFPLGPGMTDCPALPELLKDGIPYITGDMTPVSAIAKYVNYAERVRNSKKSEYKVTRLFDKKPDLENLIKPGKTLSESETKAVLEKYGIPITQHGIATSVDEAVGLSRKIGYPVALKVDSEDIPHKTEAGGVKLNLTGDEEVREAYANIMKNVKAYKPEAAINGVSVQEMLREGTEVIIGVTKDPVFGPVIMFGLGGIFVEVLKDVAFRVAPLSRGDAAEMIAEIKGNAVLKGVRGKPPADEEAIIDVILKISELVADYADYIEELDINPLIVYPEGAKAADAMMVLSK